MGTYYVRSTGEIVGPNPGTPRNLNNKKRKEFGNLYTSKRKAKLARRYIKFALRFVK
jgi:hypothetical protein